MCSLLLLSRSFLYKYNNIGPAASQLNFSIFINFLKFDPEERPRPSIRPGSRVSYFVMSSDSMITSSCLTRFMTSSVNVSLSVSVSDTDT